MSPQRQAVSIGRKQEVIQWIETVGEGVPTRHIDGGATLEELLYEEFVTKRTKKKVTRMWLAFMALTIYAGEAAERESAPPFTASDHWVSNFMRRFEISLRRTNLTVLDEATLVGCAVRNMQFLRNQLPTVDLEQTVLMDETAVSFEELHWGSTRRHSFHWVCIHADYGGADGQHHRELLKKWIDLAFPLVVHREGKCLVWDSMRAHISKAVTAKCSSRKIAVCVVPGGLTPYLQAGDIGIYKSFKDLLYLEINAWEESDKVEYTRFGNPRMPSVDTVCEWVLRAWRDTDETTITRCIEAAGFANTPSEWFIAKHDVYGAMFQKKRSEESKENEDEDLINLSALDDALDDVNLLDG
ncbi:hypothetical protein PR003_g13993 [Phytophthora rubi]|uniref:HTH CENPB-type domain-containing protein n=1 Tax=Phytophthora rubi TaxID=129364 RepID=A0A6A4F3V5_9STRA|nr:hypothetical protein PR001_g13311 [Phytophthora rubi]KAE9333494.1 hypothetical protein PR003_g13993 [Phytophthora rubi]